MAVFAAASLAVLLPFQLAYFEVQHAWEASWTLAAVAPYSADVQSYLSAPALVNDLYVTLFRPGHAGRSARGPVVPRSRAGGPGRHRLSRPRAWRARAPGAPHVFGLVAIVAFVLSLGRTWSSSA